MNNYLRCCEWATSKQRSIDDLTLIDLLALIEYQSDRMAQLEALGFQDHGGPEDGVFMIVLDALGVPAEGSEKAFAGEHERFSRTLRFSRAWFEEQFYDGYLLSNDVNGWSLSDVISLFRQEVAENLNAHYR